MKVKVGKIGKKSGSISQHDALFESSSVAESDSARWHNSMEIDKSYTLDASSLFA